MHPLRVNLWSGPRNVSTALMYAFAERRDTRVVDEPLYAHYLARSGAGHPGRELVLAAQDTDGERVVREVVLGPCDRPVLFLKQMAHHLDGLARGFLRECANVILARDPRQMLPSLVNQLPEPSLADTGLAVQSALVRELEALGQEVSVLDAKELLLDPRGVLTELCARLGIAFDEAMLSWEPGPRPEDGVWAPFWYHALHRSSGFEPYREKTEPFPARLEPVLAQCAPHYALLAERAIRARSVRP